MTSEVRSQGQTHRNSARRERTWKTTMMVLSAQYVPHFISHDWNMHHFVTKQKTLLGILNNRVFMSLWRRVYSSSPSSSSLSLSGYGVINKIQTNVVGVLNCSSRKKSRGLYPMNCPRYVLLLTHNADVCNLRQKPNERVPVSVYFSTTWISQFNNGNGRPNENRIFMRNISITIVFKSLNLHMIFCPTLCNC